MAEVKIAPSILSADFARLGAHVQEAEAGGADWIHIDVMDGRFVPPITFGPLVVSALRPITRLPLDVHLMIETPERQVADFAKAGADCITVHVETCPHLHRNIQQIKELGLKAGVTLNPGTPLAVLTEILHMVDLVLIMSVNPGYGGQAYIPASTAKVARLRRMLDDIGSTAELEIDGGVNLHTAPEIVRAGATVLVAGSAVFNQRATVAENISALRRTFR
jgi:ribulose-phosphate 3-epimerase